MLNYALTLFYKSLSHLAQLHGGDAAPTISVKEGEDILVLRQLCLGQPLSGLHGIQTIV